MERVKQPYDWVHSSVSFFLGATHDRFKGSSWQPFIWHDIFDDFIKLEIVAKRVPPAHFAPELRETLRRRCFAIYFFSQNYSKTFRTTRNYHTPKVNLEHAVLKRVSLRCSQLDHFVAFSTSEFSTDLIKKILVINSFESNLNILNIKNWIRC